MKMPEEKKLDKKDARERERTDSKKNFKRGKGNKPYPRRDARDDGVEKKPYMGPGNDFSWWNKEPTLLENAANLKSNWIAGTPIAAGSINFVPDGVLSVNMLSTYGHNLSQTDPLNVWARDLFLKMFQKYRGITAYSASDLGITLIAEIEIVKLIAKYERVYGVLNRYSKINVNLPTAELAALGISAATADYLRTHLSDFRYDLNVLIRKSQRLSIMKDMSVLADAISLLNFEYLDHDGPKSQVIIFDTTEFGIYDETSITGGMIDFQAFGSTYDFFDFSADNMCEALDACIQALLGSDGVQKILADLVVWFGEEAMLQFLPITDDYVIVPIFSESILHKLHNIVCLPEAVFVTSQLSNQLSATDLATLEATNHHYIYQVNDRIVTAVSMSRQAATGTVTWVNPSGTSVYVRNHSLDIASKLFGNALFIDTYRAAPDPEVIVEGVLFKYSASATGNNYSYFIDTNALYLVSSIQLWKMSNGTASSTTITQISTSGSNVRENAGYLSIIDWAPFTYQSNATGNIVAFYGDVDNPIVVYRNDIERLHTSIMYSAFHSDVRVINK